ncbi:MAG: DUF1385 domain-containing protein [Bryobacteraceae bacterium]
MSVSRFARFAAHLQLMPVLESGEETLVGGQAVIEGVMMRAPHSYCVAVRKANGDIVTEEMPIPRLSEKYPIFKFPILRGLGTLGQAMSLGVKALRFSANASLSDEEAAGRKPQEITGTMMAIQLAFSLGVFLFLYKFLPLYFVTELEKHYAVLHDRLAFNALDGLIRIAIFLIFLILIASFKDIKRVFEYHGAEHKVVFNFESGKPVTVENAQLFKTWHPRCGTSFLLVVMLVSMIVYAAVPVDGFVAKFLARIALLPVITGISYEMIRFAAKRRGSVLALLTAPGLWLQRITTQPPSDQQATVAICALDRAMWLEKEQGGEPVIA